VKKGKGGGSPPGKRVTGTSAKKAKKK
jgi:hypothetical protein